MLVKGQETKIGKDVTILDYGKKILVLFTHKTQGEVEMELTFTPTQNDNRFLAQTSKGLRFIVYNTLDGNFKMQNIVPYNETGSHSLIIRAKRIKN